MQSSASKLSFPGKYESCSLVFGLLIKPVKFLIDQSKFLELKVFGSFCVLKQNFLKVLVLN